MKFLLQIILLLISLLAVCNGLYGKVVGSSEKVTLTTVEGKVASLKGENILAIERYGVTSRNRSTTVHFVDESGKVVSKAFKESAVFIAEMISHQGIDVKNYHSGVYITNRGLQEADALITSKSFVASPRMLARVADDPNKIGVFLANTKRPTSLGSRASTVVLTNKVSLPAGKIATPAIKKVFLNRGMQRILLKCILGAGFVLGGAGVACSES